MNRKSFSETEELNIVFLYADKNWSIVKLAQRYKCSGGPINRILLEKLGLNQVKKIAKEHSRRNIIKHNKSEKGRKTSIENGQKAGQIPNSLKQRKSAQKTIIKRNKSKKGRETSRKLGQKWGPINIKKALAHQERSKLEIFFEKILKSTKIPFEHNQNILGTNYEADFLIKGTNLIVEVDGYPHYKLERQRTDKIRDRKIEVLGYKVIRFWAHDIINNVDNCILRLKNEVRNYVKN